MLRLLIEVVGSSDATTVGGSGISARPNLARLEKCARAPEHDVGMRSSGPWPEIDRPRRCSRELSQAIFPFADQSSMHSDDHDATKWPPNPAQI
jgi:hypothetical protein